jgi:uncharacterized repeat protein (TIGR03803 family)
MTLAGGTYSKGTMFKIDTNGTNYRRLVDFNGPNGALPRGSLTYYGGALYGMTYQGGNANFGIIFRYSVPITQMDDVTGDPFNIYPNPVQHSLQLPSLITDSHVSVYSMSGRLMMEQQIEHHNSVLNVEVLPAGTYIIELKNKYSVKTVQFIKN